MNDAGFDAIFVRYKGEIQRYCRLKLASLPMADQHAEEAVNDVFMTLYRRRDELDLGDRVRAWLYRTAENVSMNVLRAEKLRAPHEYIDDSPPRSEPASTDEYFADDVGEERFLERLRELLDDDEYALFAERFLKKRTYEQIARDTGQPYSTVRMRSLKLEATVRREIRRFTEQYSE